jgi:hypothetical protein
MALRFVFSFALFVASSPLAAYQPVAIAKELQRDLAAGYGKTIVSVTVQQQQLRIRLSEPKVTETIYTSLLPWTCALLKGRAKQFTEIVIVNRSNAQGYVYEQPAKCEAIAKTPLSQVNLAVLRDTHLL